MRERRTLAVDDVTLAYDVTGSGAAVLCVQGVGVAGRGWAPQVPALADRYRVITFDNRGIGATPRGAAPLSIETMAGDAQAILDVEGIERCHVVGHSMGGLIGLALALAAPARVQSLSMLCTFADGAGPTRPSLRMIWLGTRSRIGPPSMRRRAMQEMLFTPEWLRRQDRGALAEQLNALFGRDLGASAPIVDEQLKVMGRYDATPALGQLTGIPTLVVSGRHDPIAPPVPGTRHRRGHRRCALLRVRGREPRAHRPVRGPRQRAPARAPRRGALITPPGGAGTPLRLRDPRRLP